MSRALITGASRGIGAAIARELAAEGWEVVINYLRSEEKAAALAKELGGSAVQCDVADAAAVREMFRQIGEIELLVNNAGVAQFELFTDTDDDRWRRLLGVDLDGVRNCCREAIPAMVRQKRGCILNITSVWGVHGASCEAAYSAAKAGVIGLTKALAKELGPSGVRVNCIAPGVIDTDMLSAFDNADRQALADSTPLGRLGTPEDVAYLAAFLAGERASFITGQVIGVDGGFY